MKKRAAAITDHRIHWIDVCRGIAIILVLYGHVFGSDKQRYLIYAFHMPLFFFISGLVFKPLNGMPILSIAKKYIKQLLIPYYIFAVFTYAFAVISQLTDNTIGGVAWQLFGIVYGNGTNGMLGYNVVLWFLPCLFITKFSFALITKKVSKTKLLLVILFASALIGSLVSTYASWIKLPFGFEIALTGIPFFGAGYLFKIQKYRFANLKRYNLLLGIIALLFTIGIATINYYLSGSQVDLRVNQLDNVPLFYLGAFGGIISWTVFSQVIAKNAFLEYLGRHSMVLFAWHNILITDLQNAINSFLTHDSLKTIQFFMPTLYACTAVSIILFSRMLILKLRNAYHLVSFIKQ